MNAEYDFEAYAVGIVTASACSTLSLEDTTQQMNLEHPTGLESEWEVATQDDGTLEPFRGGLLNGGPCDRHPATHKHWLFHC